MIDMYLNKPFAEVKEIKEEISKNCIRIIPAGNWKTEEGKYENHVVLQIRSTNPISGRSSISKNQKDRNLTANVTLTVSELKQILDFAEKLYMD